MKQARQVDPKAFGRRVRECREARDMSQERLAEATGQSQSNIDWIEKGGPKRPSKQAYTLAKALSTTPEWLLYEEGPRDVGVIVFSKQQIAENYDLLPFPDQAEFSALIAKRLAVHEKPKKSG